MFFVHTLYLAARFYTWFKHTQTVLYDYSNSVTSVIVGKDAVKRVVKIDLVRETSDVVYNISVCEMMYRIYLMCFVFGVNDWKSRVSKFFDNYNHVVLLGSIGQSGVLFHVTMGNGHEFLTRDEKSFFQSKHVQRKTILCAMVGSTDITSFVTRFMHAWDGINIEHHLFIKLLQHFRIVNKKQNGQLVTVDDDTFEETRYNSWEVVKF
jgi:hypothetical protein